MYWAAITLLQYTINVAEGTNMYNYKQTLISGVIIVRLYICFIFISMPNTSHLGILKCGSCWENDWKWN